MNRKTLSSGIYFIADTGVLSDDRILSVTRAALRGGVAMVQLRAKSRPPSEVARLGAELLKVTRDFQAPLLINDLPQVALDIGADGAHVGEEDVPVRVARAMLGPQAIIGATAKSAESVRRAETEGADYVALGAFFPSPTKPDAERMSVAQAQALAALTSLPICAIGGIDETNIDQLAELAPALVCVVSAIARSDDPEQAARRLAAAMRWRPSTGRR